MRIFLTLMTAVLAAVLWQSPARAQTPRQIQGMIAAGQEGQALAALQPVLAAHPDSGIAWYLTAEAQDVAGHEDAARSALAKAQQYAPGLPFADPSKAAALQAHLNQPVASTGGGISPVLIGVGLLFVVFFVLRRVFRSRRQYMAPGGFPRGYGPGGMPYGGGGGGGLGGSILGGLAAGAGFAAGERIFDGITGGNQGIDPAYGADPAPGRDDGLNGAPGWDDTNNDNGGGVDPGNSW